VVLYQVVRTVALALGKLLFGVRVTGREQLPRHGAYIVTPPHRSFLDVPFTAFITRRRIRFLAKSELYESRIGRTVFGALGGIAVDRGATDRAAFRTLQQVLETGEPVAIFPEGTRRHGAELGAGFDGAAYLSLKLGIPIVPLGIGGTEEILARGRVLPRLHRVALVVGAPLHPPAGASARRRGDVSAVTETLRVALQSCFDDARRRAGGGESSARSPDEPDEGV
jgi:1-acyl-sn-glycerol-3-phosphate acyltransferase